MLRTFDDVLVIKNGKNQRAVENTVGRYPIYGSGGVMGHADQFICDANTVVIGRKGNINSPIFVEEPFWNVDTAFGLAACESVLLPKYLYYFCLQFDFERLNKTVTIPSLTKSDLLKIQIDVPALSEQSVAVSKLEAVETIINLRKQQLSTLETLIKARFVEMFGDPEKNPFDWGTKPLSDIIVSANNGMARRGNDSDGDIVLRLVELQDGYIDYSSPNRIALNNKEKSRYLLRSNDFLFARVNGNPLNVGRCAVFTDIGEPVYHNDHIIRVHFDESVLEGCFASALFNCDYGKKQMSNQIKTSAGQYTISQDGIGAIIAICPPVGLQKQFAAFVAQVDKSKFLKEKGDKTRWFALQYICRGICGKKEAV